MVTRGKIVLPTKPDKKGKGTNKMKEGLDVTALVGELQRQAQSKRDIAAPLGDVRVQTEDKALSVLIGDKHRFEGLTETAHNQLGTYLGIPAKFYDRTRNDFPDLYDYNINYLLQKNADKVRMFRTLDNRVRAFLGRSYNRIDNLDLLKYLAPALGAVPGLKYRSTNVTDSYMYIKTVTDEFTGQVRVGQTVRMGAILRNSEVGLASFSAYPFWETLQCLNGMTIERLGSRKYHTGSHISFDEDTYEIYSDEAREADDRAYMLKVRDMVTSVFKPDVFNTLLNDMKEAAETPLGPKPQKTIEVLAKRAGLSKDEEEAVLGHLLNATGLDGGKTQWDLASAVTRTAQDVNSYDRASQLEVLGGRIISLNNDEWRDLNPRRDYSAVFSN